MYEGSMYGAGVAVFAVWGYVISHARKGIVELNPRKLADTLGGNVDEIEKAILYLCSPDPESRWKECEGRRLVKEAEFQYRIPAWSYYQDILNEDARREYNRRKQQEHRARKKKENPLPSETTYVQGNKEGSLDPYWQPHEHIGFPNS